MHKPEASQEHSVRLAEHHNPPTNPQETGVMRSLSQPAHAESRVYFSEPHPVTHSTTNVSRRQSMKERITRGTADFFGIGDNCSEEQTKWKQRRSRGRKFSRRFKRDVVEQLHREREEKEMEHLPQIVDPLARGRQFRGGDEVDAATPRALKPTVSTGTATSSVVRRQVTRSQQRARKQSVAKMGWKTLATVVSKVAGTPKRGTSQSTLVHRKAPTLHSRSFAPSTLLEDSDDDDELDTSFFAGHVTPRKSLAPIREVPTPTSKAEEAGVIEVAGVGEEDEVDATGPPPSQPLTADFDEFQIKPAELMQMVPTGVGWKKKPKDERFDVAPATTQPKQIRRNKIDLDSILDAAFDNSDRHEFGKGIVGNWLHTKYKPERMDTMVEEQLEELEGDHRPYFTYWITFVHILITLIAVVVYGIGPIGFTQKDQSALVLMSNLAVENVGYLEPQNFWIGPRSADLIHLGAKYAPCMHKDIKVIEAISRDRHVENDTGCCIRNDKSGCWQSEEAYCSETFATFEKWTPDNPGPDGRLAGAVCGQDPRACTSPASTRPHRWADDLADWPICVEPVTTSSLPNMQCEMTGHPCCIGLQAECQIHTREYCDFVNGYFHEDATLCSQVKCMDSICGLISFTNPEFPDQFYRLWLSLFLHAGIIHCALTVVFHMTVLRDLEKLAGWLRICVIYMLSGIAGNLLSAIFIPYRAEVGPAGSLFGILACLIVEVLQSWQLLEEPGKALLKLLGIIAVLLILGLLPWIDNFAAIGGFLSGILLAFTFLPYIHFGEFDRKRKVIQMIVCFILYLVLMTVGFLVFYLYPIDCSWCYYFNCIPFTDTFCDNMDMELKERQYE
ncbi:inactive rhomboid protein 1-like isoform X2 [Ptychodera flava]|uniref:inactive rhomboid protein 1-like isoform X2 n=1 Tax=Ptychodera flava TaxID=63121 RepID=UPI003969BBC5